MKGETLRQSDAVPTQADDRDERTIGRFVDRFASELVDAGMPRMPALVFAALRASDAGRLTAGASTPAGERVAESLAFLEFLRVETPALLDRWREQRARTS